MNATQTVTEEVTKFDPRGEVYIVASFNDWIPQRMKTERRLNLEKYGIHDEDIPEEYYTLDDTIFLYGSMVAPGQHFFYLVKQK